MHIHVLQKGVTISRATETAAARAIVDEIPALLLDIGLQVFPARHPLWGRELDEFLSRTDNRRTRQSCPEEAFYHVGEWVDAVHEDPEAGEFVGASKNTV